MREGGRSVTFFVAEEPVPKARHRSAIRKKRDGTQFISQYSDTDTKKYEEQVRKVAKKHFTEPLTGALEMMVIAYFPVPESWSRPKKAKAYGQYKPVGSDTDNIFKAASDALNRKPVKLKGKTVSYELTAWKDDTQVCKIIGIKKYIASPDHPVGIAIRVTEI